ncbi:choice-of-anchor J domain-containing protein [Flavobacterium sp. MR2016-29]|uniref:T9SS-dependent choice-of-anchor J family protein n=1 Tax=Flavobacterium sp. MR2016-29 TaxID=2783795 RepID=UPI00188D77FC|nr:choice-of-anchor J domain-containing protein [Flavobacterium sp. MR2016-29]MBF4492675.1 choice-of-anchor J domain-containing protein [Flavobacterium sp. MR2016-29]
MKKNYTVRHFMAFLSFFCCLALSAQTMPSPRTLPYSQNFDGLDASAIAYPIGFQGWTAATSNPTGASQYAVSGTFGADRALVANSTAATTSGNFHNYNGKIGFLNTSGLDLTIGFAFITTGQSAIQVQYEVMTIRNPYDGTNNTRINEMILQYRVGTTADFTSIPETAYVNNTTTQTGSGITTPQNPQTIKITLPSNCDNQPVVQIRWISKQNSGGGSRPSFAIDNIKIGSDITPPVNESGYPKAVEVLSEGFDFFNKINEIGKTYYVLVAAGIAEPTPAQVKAGLNASGNAPLQAGSLTITNKDQEYSKVISGLSLGTSYIVYSVSEDASENLQVTVNKLDVTTASVLVPSLRTTASVLNFGKSDQNIDSSSLSYQISGTNIQNTVTVTAPANFSVSKDNITFQSSIVYDASDFAANATPTVYVRFKPNTTGVFSGTLTNETTGALSKTVSLSGIGINPYIQGFNDADVLTNSGWTQYNVAGALNKWSYTTVARNINSGNGAVLVNGFTDTGASKDWLISPKLHLDTFTQFALLSFYSRKFYDGPSLKLVVSTNYDGVSSPETAAWTEIDGKFPTVTGTYAQSQYIDLSAFKTPNTYVAWVYETTAGGNTLAAEWCLDDVAITNESGFVASNPVLDFDDVAVNTNSASQSFVFKANGYNDITIKAPAGYQISLDNTVFQSEVFVSAADASAGKTVYVRFTPSVKALSIPGALTVTGTALNKQIGSLNGSSLPKADTYDIVSYNLEFFGSDVKGSDGVEFGPTDDALQIENVAKVMNKLNADVYVVQEVSDDPSLDLLIQKININGKTFDKSISTSWSYSFNAPEADFPPQKLVVLYNTQTTTVKSTKVLFKDLYDQVRAGTVVLPDYPGTGTPQVNDDSFFSSGRLPYLVQVETNIGGVKKELNLIDLHARANSGTDIMKYNQRKYDVEYLKQALDAEYPNSNLVLLGDFNDDVKAWVGNANTPSSYQKFVEDKTNYNALTFDISQAGAFSFLSSGGFLDHIIISNELTDQYIPNSIAVYDPRADITSYTSTTSDHGPVIARFELKQDVLSTIDFGANKYGVASYPNPANDVLNVVVKTNNAKDLKLRLYDISGHLIGKPIEINGTQETTIIPVSHLQSGIYIYTLTENNKIVFKNKIIKK